MTDDGSVKRYQVEGATLIDDADMTTLLWGETETATVVLASDYADLEERLIAAHERVAQLERALINYAVHSRGCIPQVACTCGLSAALSGGEGQ